MIELRRDVTVRKLKGKTKVDIFLLSGLPLTRSQPAVDGWWLRGERRNALLSWFTGLKLVVSRHQYLLWHRLEALELHWAEVVVEVVVR